MGRNSTLIIVERSTNMLFMTKLKEVKRAKPLAQEVRRLLLPNKKHIRTIITDNGPEFAAHLQIAKTLGATLYFTAPYASWQKGAIESFSKLIRQYVPKSANFNEFAEKKISMNQKRIDRRAGQKLKFETSKNEFYRRIN